MGARLSKLLQSSVDVKKELDSIYKAFFRYRTKKFRVLVHYKSGYVPVNDVMVEKERFSKLCETGCSNFNTCWSCPPHAPDFNKLAKGWKYLFTFLVYADMDCFPLSVPNPLWRIINADRTLSPMILKMGSIFEKALEGVLLKDAECRLCKPCRLELKQPCAHPEKRRSSLEATGVNVEVLTLKLDHRLLWYREKKVPAYLTKVGGVLTNKVEMQNWLYHLGLAEVIK